MSKIVDPRNVNAGNVSGGVLSINDLRQTKPSYYPQQEKTPLEVIEKLMSLPELKPIYEQGARLIGAYADKLSLDNQAKYNRMNGKTTGGENKQAASCLYGVGANQP